MTNKELLEWKMLVNQHKNGYHLSDSDIGELIRLNHLVMEVSHKIHNANMLNFLKNFKK